MWRNPNAGCRGEVRDYGRIANAAGGFAPALRKFGNRGAEVRRSGYTLDRSWGATGAVVPTGGTAMYYIGIDRRVFANLGIRTHRWVTFSRDGMSCRYLPKYARFSSRFAFNSASRAEPCPIETRGCHLGARA